MDLQSQHFADFCRKSGVKYTEKNFRILWDYIKNVKWPNTSADSIIHSNVYAASFLDIKDKLEFEPPPPPPPTKLELRAERTRRLEANHNVGPYSRRDDPRQIENPDGSIDDLKKFVQRAINNIDKEARGEMTPQPKTKPIRTIPTNATPEELRSYTSAEIRNYLARRNKTPEKK